MLIRRIIFSLMCLAVLANVVDGQSTGASLTLLPSPTGRFGIGRVSMHLTDRSRVEQLATDHRNRELMIDVWYPTEISGTGRERNTSMPRFEKALGADGLRELLGRRVSELVKDGRVQTHAVGGTAFARSLKRCPLLIFSHGMGTVAQIHTAQIEELVSHGYVVAAITHTYDAWLTVFPDGRSVLFERARREAAGSSEEQHIAYENTRVEWWANDICFLLDELIRQDATHSSALPFAGHLDLKRVGAFGHSVGGRAAARACQIDQRFRACADQDGVARMLPFYLDEQGWGMNQPFLLIVRERTSSPSDDELRRMGLTRQQAESLVGELRARRDATLARTGGGAYRVVLTFAPTNHMSFSDLMMLQANDSTEAATQRRVFRTTSDYTRAFFDKTLRAMKALLLDGETKTEFVDLVQRFEPARSGKYAKEPNKGVKT